MRRIGRILEDLVRLCNAQLLFECFVAGQYVPTDFLILYIEFVQLHIARLEKKK